MSNIPLRNGGPNARIAVIPGDGIGKEVTPSPSNASRPPLPPNTIASLEFVEFDWGADNKSSAKVSTLPAGAVEMLRRRIRRHPLRRPRRSPRAFQSARRRHPARPPLQARSLRQRPPHRTPPHPYTPLRDVTLDDIRLTVFRENTEGLYVGVGGFYKKDTPDEIAVEEDVNSRKGVERIIRHAFEYAKPAAAPVTGAGAW